MNVIYKGNTVLLRYAFILAFSITILSVRNFLSAILDKPLVRKYLIV